MMLRAARTRIAPAGLVAVAVALTSATVGLISPAAIASPQTKWFTDTVGSPSSTLSPAVVFPVSSTGQKLYLQIQNATDSNQSFGSADVDLLNDWAWSVVQITTSNALFASHWSSAVDSNKHVVHLRNDGVGSQYAIAPDGWLQLQLSFNTPPGGFDVPTFVVKQSNDFSDSSTRGTSNLFTQRAPAAAIYIGAGPPAQIVYTQDPTDVQVTTGTNDTHYMCPPVAAAVEDQDGNLVSWLPATAVTLSSTGTPGLKLDGSSTLSADTSNGIATFGTGNTTTGCTGLTATIQGSYKLTATTTVAAGAGYTGGTFSTSAVDYNVYLQLCASSCNVDLPGGTQTNANLNATNGTGDPAPLLGFISPSVLASRCDTSISYRPDQTTVLLDNHDKSITLAWSKKVTNQDPRNGTPFWPVCIQGPYDVYISNGAGGATLGSAKDGAMLVLCSTPGVVLRQSPLNPGPDHACIQSLYKNAASEHAVIWVPDQPGDPHMW